MPDQISDKMWYDKCDEFWNSYRRGRAVVPSSLYQKLYDYHISHGGHFGTLYDAGAGIGQDSAQFTKRFSHVVVGEPTAKTITIAREALESNGVASKCSFRQEKLEESTLAKDSVDAVFIANALHFTDVERSMEVVHSLLKPGGTLFLCYHAMPRFDDKVQKEYSELYGELTERETQHAPRSVIQRIMSIQDSAFDDVALPTNKWETVIRLKMNTFGDPDAFCQAPGMTKDIPRVSKVSPSDKIVEEKDRDWFFPVNSQKLKDIIATYPFTNPDPTLLQQHFAKLEKLLDGQSYEGWWPCSIVMATRRADQ